ncbi:Alcohol dehydrogenase [Yamadazyma tenuis]|uniref:GroES-like protein n=1 Tax=Candida tenuis (strain ATCC 10573 / BCRC 21748 / CBS 615 / JCM 9827 / NBRC 10315 / NRRL Y-1498 / VKM Y-70) TaxID=590646 RepID=G3BEG1_CANTC|nr:GroES-like protein [Yamadazyma tenuis ATCC 10573]EGV60538.1 GroES-like protein [Yamadazyma tenuis ATCC 10573]WEJ94222.1 Alcohol dehydrogenase [Yamadazyma tenuis]
MSSSIPSEITGFTVPDQSKWDQPVVQKYPAKKMLEHDVVIKVQVCSVCGTDHHTTSGGWGPTKRKDQVVGHEIVGKVVAKGDKVPYSIGDLVGVGAQSNSCGQCSLCLSDNEQYCTRRVQTYNSIDPFSDNYANQGGFASHIIVNHRFAFKIPDGLTPEEAAPLFCAGLTVYSPLIRNLRGKKSPKVGIVGIGGLGHLALQFANKMGAHVVAISRSSAKKDDASKLGAHEFVATKESENWHEEHASSFDLILNCATSFSDLDIPAFFNVVKPDGKIIGVGLPDADETITLSAVGLTLSGKYIGGSVLGSPQEAVEMLQFAVEHNVRPWIEIKPLSIANYADSLTRISKSDAHYRLVLNNFESFFS